MARHLRERDREAIIAIIDGWPSELALTWDMLVAQIRNRMKVSPTRQTLSSHADIKLAFQSRKKRGRPPRRLPAPTHSELREQLARAQAKIERLEMFIETLREMLVRYEYNAVKHGVSPQMLESPLPAIDRDRTD